MKITGKEPSVQKKSSQQSHSFISDHYDSEEDSGSSDEKPLQEDIQKSEKEENTMIIKENNQQDLVKEAHMILMPVILGQ